MLISAFQFVMPQFTQYIIDKVIPKSDFHLLFRAVALLLIAAIILGLLNYFSTYYMGVMSQNAITTLRNELYKHIINQDTYFFLNQVKQVI